MKILGGWPLAAGLRQEKPQKDFCVSGRCLSALYTGGPSLTRQGLVLGGKEGKGGEKMGGGN